MQREAPRRASRLKKNGEIGARTSWVGGGAATGRDAGVEGASGEGNGGFGLASVAAPRIGRSSAIDGASVSPDNFVLGFASSCLWYGNVLDFVRMPLYFARFP
ncbi:hypothetical protein NL676_026143 [Syzygium grande]|nr:hypothetical protein NL676_026143 [Syzygium grande]